MSDPTDLLLQLAERSERILRLSRNMRKDSWLLMRDWEIRARVREEIEELLAALKYGTWEEIADEAADVYHMAAMGADRDRRGRGGIE